MAMLPDDRRMLKEVKKAIGYRPPTGNPTPKGPLSSDPEWNEIALFFADQYPNTWKAAFFAYIAGEYDCPLNDVIDANSDKFADIPDDVSDNAEVVPLDICTRLSAPKIKCELLLAVRS